MPSYVIRAPPADVPKSHPPLPFRDVPEAAGTNTRPCTACWEPYMSITPEGAGQRAVPVPIPPPFLLMLLSLIAAAVTLLVPAAGKAHAVSRASQTLPPAGQRPSPGTLYRGRCA